MTADRRDKDLRPPVRRPADARAVRPPRRAFRPLRWAWLLLLVALLAPAVDLFFPAGWRPPRERRTVVIERGQSLHEISRELQRVGVIKSQVGFLVLARAMRLDRRVKAGQYSFRLGTTVPALLRALDRGMYGLNLVTIPEGLMIREAARLIQLQVGIPAGAIDSLARDPALLDSLEIGAPSLEGWLAPDSYEWLPGTSPEVVLRTMVTRTRERVERATAGYDSLPLGMNAHELLTLASIVESESRANDERPRIARVYLNRLERGMLLQADPTVGYALGRGPRSRLLFRDLRVESPYNTYRHEGLPPGPICSPGEAAIFAVMNAQPGINDLYFVANGKGRHIFAPTYQQHLANIAFVKSKMKAEAAAAATAARRALADDEEVVSGAAGDSALAPGPPGTSPAHAPIRTPAPSGAVAKSAVTPTDSSGKPRVAAPAPGLAARPTTTPSAGALVAKSAGTSADSAAKPRASTATASGATAGPAKSATATTPPRPTASTGASSAGPARSVTATTPAKPAASPGTGAARPGGSSSPPSASGPPPAPLKGTLLVPKGASVASSSPNTATVVRRPAAKATKPDSLKAAAPARPAGAPSAKPDTARAPAKKPAPKPAATPSKPSGQ